MGKILALDWDQRQLRYVVAVIGRKTVKVLAAAEVAMSTVREADGEERPDPAATLKSRLGRSAARLPALVGVDRASVETLPLTLPPASDAELPELVLNQAMRESASITEDTALDFLPLGGAAGEPREVLAAALAADAMAGIKVVCSQAGIKPARMLLRPYASASLFLRSQHAQVGMPCLLVNLVGDEVDLTVVAESKIVFTRTARIPHSDAQAETDRRVLAEIGRTLMVAMQQRMGDQSVSQVHVFGSPGEHQGLIEAVSAQFELSAAEFDPFDAVEIRRKAVPEHAGSFGPLLGMLLDEADGAKHAIDFLHPRRAPKPPDRRRLLAAIAALLVTGGLFVWYQQSQELKKLDGTIAALAKTRDERKAQATRAVAQAQVVNSLRAWHNADMNWLDELRDLSVRFPSAADMVVLQMALSPGRAGGAAITFSGLARDPKIVVRMESNIRDRYHDIRSKRVQERGPQGSLAWSFETSLVVAPRPRASYVAHRKPQDSAPAQAAVASSGEAAGSAPQQQGGRP